MVAQVASNHQRAHAVQQGPWGRCSQKTRLAQRVTPHFCDLHHAVGQRRVRSSSRLRTVRYCCAVRRVRRVDSGTLDLLDMLVQRGGWRSGSGHLRRRRGLHVAQLRVPAEDARADARHKRRNRVTKRQQHSQGSGPWPAMRPPGWHPKWQIALQQRVCRLNVALGLLGQWEFVVWG